MKKLLLFLFCVGITFSTLNAAPNYNFSTSKTLKNLQRKIFFRPNDALINKIETWRTKNNIKVYYLETKNLPILDVHVIFNVGSGYDNEKFGLAYLTNLMLKEGAGKLTSKDIALEFDKIGVNFYLDVKRDFSLLALRALSDKNITDKAINLLTLILKKANFPKEEFIRIKNQTLNDIQMENQQPEILANNKFFEFLYKTHPYAHNTIGNANTVAKINSLDLVDFYQKYYVAENANIILIGNIDIKNAKNYAEKIAASLKIGKKAAPLPYAKMLQKNISKNIKFVANQAYIKLGFIGVNYQNKDLYPLIVGNYILGGGMTSRLFVNVRDKHGLSYDTNSSIVPLKYNGVFILTLQTKNTTRKLAINLSKNMLEKFIRDGVSDKEVDKAKQYLIGSFALNFDSNNNIANMLTILASYNLPDDYMKNYINNIKKVTRAKICTAFQRLYKNNKLLQVVVG